MKSQSVTIQMKATELYFPLYGTVYHVCCTECPKFNDLQLE